MSKGTAWFPCYASDLLGSMRWKMMTPAQRGAYWQLICWQMQSADGHLPADIAQLSALADMDVSAHPLLLEAFPEGTEGRRANPKALALWQARAEFSSAMSACGKEGNAKRWGRQSSPDRVPDRVPDKVGDSEAIASASLSTSTSTSISISIPTQPIKVPFIDTLKGCDTGKLYGELQKVRLTADEHAKLTHTHGAAKLAQGIDILDAYIASSGKRYKSHYAVLKPSGWVWDRVAGQGQPPTPQNALRGGFQRVQEAPAEPNRRTPEEWDRIIAADEARKKGCKA